VNIHQRINEVRKKIDYIKKEKVVQTYKAVTHDQVTAMVRDYMVEFGIVIYPDLVSTVTVDTGERTSKGTPMIRVEAVYDFDFVNIEDGADRETVRVSAHANDTGDKAPGKALSYAKKMVVLKVFEIETGEDDESRYDEFDTDAAVAKLAAAKTIDELKVRFQEAFDASSKDSTAQKAIILAKNKRAKELEDEKITHDEEAEWGRKFVECTNDVDLKNVWSLCLARIKETNCREAGDRMKNVMLAKHEALGEKK
jgi:hypothetical protein